MSLVGAESTGIARRPPRPKRTVTITIGGGPHLKTRLRVEVAETSPLDIRRTATGCPAKRVYFQAADELSANRTCASISQHPTERDLSTEQFLLRSCANGSRSITPPA